MSIRAFFVPQRDEAGRELFSPTDWARVPWGDTISGNYLGGLLALIGERDVASQAAGKRPARLTVDLLRPAALAPVSVTTGVVRAGRRLLLAAMTHHSHDGIATGTAVLVDETGAFGTASATALVNPGFSPPRRSGS